MIDKGILKSRFDKSVLSLISANKLVNRFTGDMVHRLNKVELQCKASFECHSHQDSKVKFCFGLKMKILCFNICDFESEMVGTSGLPATARLQPNLNCKRVYIYSIHLRLKLRKIS